MADLSNSGPKLMWSGLRATRVPWCIQGDNAEDKPMCRCGWDDDIKGDNTAGKIIWDRDALAVQIMTDGSDDSPLGGPR